MMFDLSHEVRFEMQGRSAKLEAAHAIHVALVKDKCINRMPGQCSAGLQVVEKYRSQKSFIIER